MAASGLVNVMDSSVIGFASTARILSADSSGEENVRQSPNVTGPMASSSEKHSSL